MAMLASPILALRALTDMERNGASRGRFGIGGLGFENDAGDPGRFTDCIEVCVDIVNHTNRQAEISRSIFEAERSGEGPDVIKALNDALDAQIKATIDAVSRCRDRNCGCCSADGPFRGV